ncbi:unnamed protein product [Adineta steineri]|uniref:Zinc-binding loop region of homing endonuclease domain-containing protein n=1 Tax=Adineta steineri TaxID=433720 RepID=A0A813Q8I7_9BILA|nr:unnamed protein product [Adineta steineri]
MTSDDHRNGEYFFKWMTCSLPKKYKTSLPRSSPRLHINKNGDMARQLQQKNNDYGILKHHIILRATDPSFTNAKTGPHLCDTKGCVLAEHLVIENFDVNLSRIRCEGVTLLIRHGNETLAGRIIQATPCRHGINGDDDGFKNICRKLKIYVQDVIK